jgi:hypothetical protein
VLDKDTMRDVIDVLIEKGHVIKIVPEGDEAIPPPHKCYCMQEGQEEDFFHWSLYTAHHNRGMVFGDHSKTEVLLEIKTIHQSGKAAKNRLIIVHALAQSWGLIRVIEISWSYVLVYRHGGKFNPFVGARIVAGIMQFIAGSMMMSPNPNVPDNIIGRGLVGALNEVFHVDLQTAVQKTKNVLEFCMRFGNGVSLPHSIYFSYLQHEWDAANVTLQDLMGPVVDRAVNQNDRCCPVCLDLVLLQKFGIQACGHPIHKSCWRLYRDWMYDYNQVVACPVCQFDTQGYCYQVRL